MPENIEEERQLTLPVAAGDVPSEEGPSQGEAAAPETSPPAEPSEPQAPAGSEASPPSWREQAEQYGIDLSQYESDDDALRYLAEQQKSVQDNQALAQYGQEFVRHAADGSWQEYQQWKQKQAHPAAPAEPDPLSWNAPEYDPNWLRQVKHDEAGNMVPDSAQGGTPETVAKIQNYLQFVQNQNQRMWQEGPANYMKPAIERIAEERAKKIVEGELTKYGEQIDARHFIVNNKNWLYKLDDAGQITYQNNEPALSLEGQAFFGALQRVDGKKNWSQADKQEYALEAVYNFRQMQSLQAKPAPTPEQRKEEQLAKAAGFVPQESGSLTQGSGGSNAETPQHANQTFKEMLESEFKAAGIEPSDDLVTA
jgi:hypothetical protein